MNKAENSALAAWQGIDLNDPLAVVRHALALYHPHVALACSFSIEDAALIDMLLSVRKDARVFALDTGRLNPETYDCAEQLRRRYKVQIEWYFPKHEAVEQLERSKGLFSFKQSVEERKECCGIRKVEPLNRALAGMKAWITGLRREQSVTRTDLQAVEIDASHGGMVKINPLVNWSLEDTWNYTRERRVPHNALYDTGYTSIGCAPCTRAIEPGEDQRAGRWWWENPDHKECGLHLPTMKTWHPTI